MPEWLPTLLNWLAVLGGIILMHSLTLYFQFHKDSEGYIWWAVKKLKFLLFMFFAVEWIIGAFFFYLIVGLPQYVFVPQLLIAGIIGIVVAAIPTAIESIFLPKSGTTVETLESNLTKLLLKLNIALRYEFASTIESCREQDVYDCQQPEGWGLGLSPKEIGRNIRKLYEFYKYKIAEGRNDSTLLHYDVDRTPWDHFYLLVRHLGREKLREYIKRPIDTHCPNWDGSEKRRVNGTKEDRNVSSEPDRSRCRRYDDPKLIRPIPSGQIDPNLLS